MSFNKEKVMDSARKFVDKGQIDKAVKEYLRVVKEDPKDVRVWLKIGDLYVRQGAKQDASETYLRVAQFYEHEGFGKKAVAVYEQILKIDPRVEVNIKLAELYRESGLNGEAMRNFEAAASHFHREGNTKDALLAVRRVVELDPNNIATRIKLAELYSKESMTPEAIAEFTFACDHLRKANRPDDFIKVAERLLWHEPANHALNRELATLYLQRKDPRRALQKLQASFKADPRDVDTLGLLAQAFFALDQKAKTVSVFKELAKIHLQNKHRDRATDVYRKVLELAPTDEEALGFFGKAMVTAPTPTPQPTPATPPARRVPVAPPAVPVAPARALTPPPHQTTLRMTEEVRALSDVKSTGASPLVTTDAMDTFALPAYDDDNDGNFEAVLTSSSDIRGYGEADAHAEQHAEEISKVLAESDVYVKYGLHQKAIDHLQRIFAIDERNFEARERLKDIFLAQGRNAEAEVELLFLAELVVPFDARRAEDYLRELFGISPSNYQGMELARRHRLPLARQGSVAGQAAQSAHGSPAPGRPPAPPAGPSAARYDQAARIDDELNAAEMSDSLEREVAAELDGEDYLSEELPFDAEDARAFDQERHGSNFDELELGVAGGQATAQHDIDAHAFSGSMELEVREPALVSDEHGQVTRGAALSLEDALEEAEYFVSQSQHAEAIDVLRSLLERFPDHPLIQSKLMELEEGEGSTEFAADSHTDASLQVADHFDTPPPVNEPTGTIGYDELEELDAADDDFASDSLLESHPGDTGSATPRPTVMLQKPVDDSDAATHYDLGLAYKEMGLYPDAIKAFEQVLKNRAREVQSRMMIGICHREQGNGHDAIHQFKQALHAPGRTELEQQSLYYEMGITYEAMEDFAEALYYFEMLMKRDAKFADAAARVASLRAQIG